MAFREPIFGGAKDPQAWLLLVQLMALLIASSGSPRAGAVRGASGGHVPLFKQEDFIVVINTDQERFKLAIASRPLRTGIRTFIALDNATFAEELNKAGNEHGETYAFFPNRQMSGPDADKPGDTRWQAAPFMAHHHYGPTYKWLLLGDDDTLWFMLGIKRLLHGYDASLPYAISDHLGDHNPRGFFVPSPLAAVCSPCHWPDLLRSRRREDLLARGPAEVTAEEAAGWEPTDLDGWGVARRMARDRAAAAAASNGSVIWAGATATVGAASVDGGAGGAEAVAGGLQERAGGGQEGGRRGGAGGARAGAVWRRRKRQMYEGQQQHLNSAVRAMLTMDIPQEQQRRQHLQQQQQQEQHQHHRDGQGLHRLLQQWQEQQPTAGTMLNVSALLQLAYYGSAGIENEGETGTGGGTVANTKPLPPAQLPPTAAPIPPPGCPCRPAQGCLHRARVCRGTGRGQELCGRSLVFKASGFRGNRTWCRHSWAHGGAGVVLSLGMMAATAGGPTEECARTTHVHSCDMNLAMCLMRAGGRAGVEGGDGAEGEVAGGVNSSAVGGGDGGGSSNGFMFTHPGNAALHGALWADPRYMVFDNPVYPQVVHDQLGFVTRRVVCSRGARAAATDAAAAVAEKGATEEEEEGKPQQNQQQQQKQHGGGIGAAPPVKADAAVGSQQKRGGRRLGGAEPPLSTEALWVQATSDGPFRDGNNDGGEDTEGATQLRAIRQHFSEYVLGGDGHGSVSSGDEDQDICEWLVRHVVSVHMHGRSFPSYDAAAAAMSVVVRHHIKAMKVMWDMQQQRKRSRTGTGPGQQVLALERR